MKKKPQAELLEQLIELMTPVSNLARYQIQKINEQIAEQQKLADIKKTRTAANEMKKEYDAT